MKDATARRLSRVHTGLYRTTGGRVGKRLVANDMLLLTTKGRTSGREHTVPLLFLQADDAVVVMASWGGRDYHPDWYLNLVAEPRAVVTIRGTSRRVVARTAEGEEREGWWQRAQSAYRGYQAYQSRTHREIPIVILEPDDA